MDVNLVDVDDVKAISVAQLRLQVTYLPSSSPSSMQDREKLHEMLVKYHSYAGVTEYLQPDKALMRCSEEVYKWLRQWGPRQSPYLCEDQMDLWASNTVMLPHPLGEISLPMWVFTIPAYEHRSEWKRSLESISNLLSTAAHRLNLDLDHPGNPEDDGIGDDVLIEWLCETSVLLPMALVYRPDHSGDRSIEQWAWWARVPPQLCAKAGLDCEDNAESVLRILFMIQEIASHPSPASPRSSSSSEHPLLLRTLELSRRYEFFMCVGSLELDGENLWHCFVMGFDAEWIKLHRDQAQDRYLREPRLPCVLLEGTSYLTSNYRYRNTREELEKYLKRPIKDDHILTKVPSAAQIASSQYHHLIMALTPQWVESHGIGELFFCAPLSCKDPDTAYDRLRVPLKPEHKECIGVPLTPLLNYNPSNSNSNSSNPYKEMRIYVPTRIDKKALDAAHRYLQWLPPYNDLPTVLPYYPLDFMEDPEHQAQDQVPEEEPSGSNNTHSYTYVIPNNGLNEDFVDSQQKKLRDFGTPLHHDLIEGLGVTETHVRPA